MTITNEKLRKAYEGSYYTILGAGGVLQEWKDGYADLLQQRGIGSITEWIEFSGKEMNAEFSLTGNNRYPNDLHCLAFSLEGLDVGKLAIFRLQMGDSWFDDIVDNNVRREEEKYERVSE